MNPIPVGIDGERTVDTKSSSTYARYNSPNTHSKSLLLVPHHYLLLVQKCLLCLSGFKGLIGLPFFQEIFWNQWNLFSLPDTENWNQR